MTTFRGRRGKPALRGDKASAHPASHDSRIAVSRFRRSWLWAALLLSSLLAAPLTAALAQTTPTVSVFAPANATATAQAQAAAQATAAPSTDVAVQFGAFKYLLDPDCLDQHYIVGLRSEQDPATGDNVAYIKTLVFLKAGSDGWIIIPQGENKATGPDAGKPLGARLCAGEAGSQ